MNTTIPNSDEIYVHSLVYQENNASFQGNYQKMMNLAVDKVWGHLSKNMHFHLNQHNPPQSFGNTHYRKDFALTSEDIMVIYALKMEGETFDDAIPQEMEITILSHKTPVNPLKQELTDIIVKACNEIKI